MDSPLENICDRDLIPSYIDGELDLLAQNRFERHLKECGNCRDELRAHRLFVCDLDSALTTDIQIDVPKNFSQVVAARAVSDMSGVRSAAEKRKTLAFCLLLAVTGFGLLGGATREIAFSVVRRVAWAMVGVAGFFWNAVYDSIVSIAVISRVLSRKFIVETGSLGVVVVLLALAVILLSRLISGYHRTGATD
jgi:predicted anti-sigma-YlaC factor YlaD